MYNFTTNTLKMQHISCIQFAFSTIFAWCQWLLPAICFYKSNWARFPPQVRQSWPQTLVQFVSMHEAHACQLKRLWSAEKSTNGKKWKIKSVNTSTRLTRGSDEQLQFVWTSSAEVKEEQITQQSHNHLNISKKHPFDWQHPFQSQ
jgi:hypothetical protein